MKSYLSRTLAVALPLAVFSFIGCQKQEFVYRNPAFETTEINESQLNVYKAGNYPSEKLERRHLKKINADITSIVNVQPKGTIKKTGQRFAIVPLFDANYQLVEARLYGIEEDNPMREVYAAIFSDAAEYEIVYADRLLYKFSEEEHTAFVKVNFRKP